MKASRQQRRYVPNRSSRARLSIITLLALFGSLTLVSAQQPSATADADTSAAASRQDPVASRQEGPVLSSSEIAQGAILLRFDRTDGGLRLKNSGRGAFEIAGADHVWFPAEAHLVDGVVVVSTSLVQQPTMVRYRWSNRNAAVLFNSRNLPALPFQTAK